jgi:hypothetical protein
MSVVVADETRHADQPEREKSGTLAATNAKRLAEVRECKHRSTAMKHTPK